eukprot:gnl/MRDRNA2_/MRDRNA2_202454_c0_seq1.p1 gnl/MRDRNA2_/MRDRNA2_202454_c0~~gnl/MRDRNA2_/MRDRNA2_202454_c0_seq1.p1  ORF type:complete len:158 (+),score=22.73 gnl/MRDRNA2_/MRDRNA2_202454_c0_seq1:28-474(+)
MTPRTATSPVGIPVPTHSGVMMIPPVNPSAQYALAGIHEVFLSKEHTDRENHVEAHEGNQRLFGFANVPAKDGMGLLVSWIDDKCLLAQWNRNFPERAVGVGDRILAVNSTFHDIDSMRQELERDRVVLLIQAKTQPGNHNQFHTINF